MVDHHDARAVETLGLVHKQVAALVVHVVGNDKALWKVREWIQVNYRHSGNTIIIVLFVQYCVTFTDVLCTVNQCTDFFFVKYKLIVH